MGALEAPDAALPDRNGTNAAGAAGDPAGASDAAQRARSEADTRPIASPFEDTLLQGRYAIREEVGRGGMATVSLAIDTALGRSVAVKVLLPHVSRERRFVERFLEMERRIARLTHPHLVTIYDAGVVDDQCYVVMEYVAGGSLRRRLSEGRRIAIPDALRIVCQIADALQLLHEQGIVHADLKPDNILLDERDDAKLVDFGIAQVARTTEVTGSLERLGGSAAYLAPEQLETGRADARTDVYALGLVTYELLAGRPPFQGDHWVAVTTQRLVRDPAPLQSTRPDLPGQLDHVITRALARDPDQRFQSAAAFARALRQVHLTPASATETTPPDLVATRVSALAARGPEPDDTTIRIPTPALRAALRPENTPTGAVPDTQGRRPRQAPPRPADAGRRLVTGMSRHASTLGATVSTRGATLWRQLQQDDPQARRYALIGLLTLLLATIVLWSLLNPPRTVAVPDLAGQPLEAGQATAAQAGLKLKVVEEFSDVVPQGHVIRQQPAAAATLRTDQRLTAVVSRGLPPVPVPNLSNRRLEDARKDLEAAGLAAGKVEERETRRPPWGIVVGQGIRAGTPMARGTPVDLVVGIPPWTSTPKLVDRSIGDAEADLQKQGLRLGEVRLEPAAGKRAGTVVAQEPAPGVRLRQGESVSVAIAVPPPSAASDRPR